MSRRKPTIQALFICLFSLSVCFPAYAENPVRDVTLIAGGASRIVSGVFALPIEVLKGATQSFPFGILTGAIRGTAKTIGGVLGGTFQAAKGAAPYAKYAALL